MPSDIAIGTANLPTNAPRLTKPSYLVTLVDGKVVTYFIALDKPELASGFISVRGFYCEASEEEVVKGFVEMISKTPKETVLEMMFPTHRVKSIRSLVFNAAKPTMINR